jgi:hypothetical protein
MLVLVVLWIQYGNTGKETHAASTGMITSCKLVAGRLKHCRVERCIGAFLTFRFQMYSFHGVVSSNDR